MQRGGERGGEQEPGEEMVASLRRRRSTHDLATHPVHDHGACDHETSGPSSSDEVTEPGLSYDDGRALLGELWDEAHDESRALGAQCPWCESRAALSVAPRAYRFQCVGCGWLSDWFASDGIRVLAGAEPWDEHSGVRPLPADENARRS